MSSIKRHGGKHYLAKDHVALAPLHKRFLEPYAGGLSFLFAKPYKGISEWVCDTDGDLITWWRVLRDTPDPVLRRLWGTPFSEASFEEACEILKNKSYANDVERATAFFTRCRMSAQGLGTGYCTPTDRQRRHMNEQVSAWWGAIEGLLEVHERLLRVEIWNRPALEALAKLDGPDLFAYLDPPYLHSTRKSVGEYKEHEMTPEQHEDLLKFISTTECKWMLCGYPSDMYEDYSRTHGWQRFEFKIANHASRAEEKPVKTEVVWCNYLPHAARKTGLGII